jgi:transposase InsO family protein
MCQTLYRYFARRPTRMLRVEGAADQNTDGQVISGEHALTAPSPPIALRKEVGVWQAREQLRLAIITWIERTYHRRRRQRSLGRLTPIEYETINQAGHAA